MKHTPEYVAWRNMRIRCTKPTNNMFRYYGGRGICVSPKFDTFEGFYAALGPRPDGYSLDRIDVNGHYEPGNVRWADKRTQMRNRRDNHFLTHNGETMAMRDWSTRTGIAMGTLWRRIAVMGWDTKRALTTPVRTPSEVGRLGAEARWT